jgi:hypothetical protein
MKNAIDIASDTLLGRAGIDASQLQSALGSLMVPGVDYADLYFQILKNESWLLEDGVVRSAGASTSQGVGYARWPENKPALPMPTSLPFRHSPRHRKPRPRSLARARARL